jgi:ABC-type lipoprotein export system ATPase subunit
VITHDPAIARRTERIVTLQDGRITEDERLEPALAVGSPATP